MQKTPYAEPFIVIGQDYRWESEASVIPHVYVPPLGTPLYWMNEQSGNLSAAVKAFYAHMLDRTQPFSDEQRRLVVGYLEYVIHAPCWKDGESGELAALRESVKTLRTVEGIDAWIQRCLEIGLDPL